MTNGESFFIKYQRFNVNKKVFIIQALLQVFSLTLYLF